RWTRSRASSRARAVDRRVILSVLRYNVHDILQHADWSKIRMRCGNTRQDMKLHASGMDGEYGLPVAALRSVMRTTWSGARCGSGRGRCSDPAGGYCTNRRTENDVTASSRSPDHPREGAKRAGDPHGLPARTVSPSPFTACCGLQDAPTCRTM